MRNRVFLIITAIVIIVILAVFIAVNKFSGPSAMAVNPQENKSIQALQAELQNLQKKGDLLAQKAIYQKLINDFPGNKDVGPWQKKLEEVNIKIIFSPLLSVSAKEYEVQPLDTLSKIARQFNTTVELIKKSNHLSSDMITPGRKLRVWTGKFSIFVDKSQNILLLKSNDELIRSYNVSTGANNSTPVGTFKIVNKLVNPVWYKEGAAVPAGSPENILGSRWLGFDLKGYGIHGTTDPSSIGTQATAGCIRMLKSDVEELYDLVPQDTEVTVMD